MRILCALAGVGAEAAATDAFAANSTEIELAWT